MAEALTVFGTEEARRQKAGRRLAEGVAEAFDNGSLEYKVPARWFGLVAPRYDREVYAETAAQLAEQGMSIDAHRVRDRGGILLPGNIVPSEKTEVYDVVRVLSADGIIQPHQEPPSNRVQQLYP